MANSLPWYRTMPGKAAPTRVLTSTSPLALLAIPVLPVVQDEISSTKGAGAVDNPAMITLQRAASGQSRRTLLRPEAYISFPTPTFNKTTSGFVISLFGDGWQRPDNTLIHASFESMSMTSHSRYSQPISDRAFVDHGRVQPSRVTTAEPVCTDVIVDRIVHPHFSDLGDQFRPRRCSTKYISRASTHEIIWDEKISTNSNGTSRRTSTEQSRQISMRVIENGSRRRHSLAVEKLETQYSKGVRQSRQASMVSRGTDVGKAASTKRRSTNGKSLHNALNLRLPGFNSDDQPESVQPSRASAIVSKQKLTGPGLEVHLTTITGEGNPNNDMDFFPPVLNRTGLGTSADPLQMKPWRSSCEAKDIPDASKEKKRADSGSFSAQQRKGSMLGQITGVRKMSVRKNSPKLEGSGAIARKTRSRGVEEDEQPLLGQFKEWPAQSSS
jgi:hypothetical protein